MSCGDLDEREEYLIPVIFDLLLSGSEAAIGPPAGESFITSDLPNECTLGMGGRSICDASESRTPHLDHPLGHSKATFYFY